MKSYSKLTSHHNSRVKSGDASELISATSMKYQYAIQSVPQSITHAKSAFRDYFGKAEDAYPEGERAIDDEGELNKAKNNGDSSMKRNIYTTHKQQLATVLRDLVYAKLKPAFHLLARVERRHTTVKKTPTFSQKLSQSIRSAKKVEQTNYQAHAPPSLTSESVVDVPTNLVGRISRQSISYVTSEMGSAPVSPSGRTRTASKHRFIDNDLATFRENNNNIIIVNKLMILEDAEMLSQFGQAINSRNSVNVIKDTRLETVNLTKSKNARMFSILNEK